MRPILPLHDLFLLFLIVSCLPAIPIKAQDDVKEAPSLRPAGEMYRVRVQNVEWGRVEASADGGLHYAVIGRVRRPATQALVERGSSNAGIVLRSGTDGLAFTISAGRVVKLRPQPSARDMRGVHLPAPTLPYEIVTNLLPGSGLFGELTLSPGASVRLQLAPQTISPIPADHSLSTGDVFVFIAPVSKGNNAIGSDTPQSEAARIDAVARAYLIGSISRARAEKRTVFTGTLTLKAQLPEGEPDPIAAVTYTIDDDLIAAQNVGPYAFDWDTRRAADGEHVVEISALNRNGRVITHARALVVVNNGKSEIGAQ
jgi:hypothetical protein